ncbi:hypothetical protein ACFWWM_12925 [Streptomyces sp. NPDC058682]|uniref:hypothetical protein n=1 Tax=Streptomyces sp. NPDC058682 TaxID=3346596 RepID=UPI0036479683
MAGPFQTLPVGDNASVELYLLRYGKDGLLRSPATEAAVKETLTKVTDVYFFAHGWNNVFATALDRYQSFAAGYIGQRIKYGVPHPGLGDYRPLLVGAIWPSTSFVMPWEEGPAIAGWPDSPAALAQEELLTLSTSELNADEDRAFVDAVDGRTTVNSDTAKKLAAILLRSMRSTTDPDDGSAPPDVKDLLNIWAELGGENSSAGGAYTAAGPDIDLRGVLRATSVWKMKTRARAVGTRGVAPLLDHILHSETAVRLHLIGHSFGACVVLSALNAVAGRAHAMLLLQPAVNRWCLAPKVRGNGQPGGYHSVLEKVEQPILTTFSSCDWPLTKVFHLAMKGKHLGEQQPQISAVGDTDSFGALGGYGPAGLDGQEITCNAVAPGEGRYPRSKEVRVVAIQGDTKVYGKVPIPGHGDISNPFTWWALHDLTRGD